MKTLKTNKMQTNYFKKQTEAIKHAILNIEEPFIYYPKDNGTKHIAENQRGMKIWEVAYINEIMGYLVSVYPNNLKTNQ